MEEIEALRAKAIASMASSASQKKSPKSKEEGELSSSDDASAQETPTCSPAVTTTVATPPVESNAALSTKSNLSLKTGKLASVNDPASSADIRLKASVRQNYSKCFVRNSVTPVLGSQYTSTWYAPSVPNNNLVISFSDDDSGSDSQEQIPDETSRRKEIGSGADRVLAQVDIECASKNTKDQLKRKPRISLSRTFVSSLTKIHGADSRSKGTLGEPGSSFRNSDSHNNTRAGQENEASLGVNLNNNKLEDLRQQIAIRENQLKLKTVQQSKHASSASHYDHNATNPNNNATKKSRPASCNTRSVSSEPEKKRLKLEHYQRKLNPVDQWKLPGPATKTEPKSRLLPVENIRQKGGNLMMCSQVPKETVGTVHVIGSKQPAKVSNQASVLSRNPLPKVKDGESSRPFNEITSSEMHKSQLYNKQGGSSSDVSSSCLQSGNSNRPVDLSVALNRSTPSVQMISREDSVGACQFKTLSAKNSDTDGLKLTGTFEVVGSSAVEKAVEQTVAQNSKSLSNEAIPSVPLKDSVFDHCSALVPESKLQTSKASPSTISLWDCSAQVNLLGRNQMNINTLLEMEESHDKELEEAQEHRRRCEVEERNALKAYREAQKALFEANARCTSLYRKRELFSARFRTMMMEDPSSLEGSSMWNNHPNPGTDFLNIVPEIGVQPLPSLSHQTYAALEARNHDSNVEHTGGASAHTSEPCNKPSAKDNDTGNGVGTPSYHTNMSADEDEEASPFGYRTTESMIIHEDVEIFDKRAQDFNINPERVSSIDNVNDYALLEASLRSELFARLGTRNVLKNKNIPDVEDHRANDGNEVLAESKSSDTTTSKKTNAESQEEQISNFEGTDRSERNICLPSIQVNGMVQGLGTKSSDYNCHQIGDPEESSSALAKASWSPASIAPSPSPVFKLAFSYVQVTPLISFRTQSKTEDIGMSDLTDKVESDVACSGLLLGILRERVKGNVGEVGCFACDFSVDPFWPVCMFELRGKCNDEECLCQHEKDYSRRNIHQHGFSESTDSKVAVASDAETSPGACSLYHNRQGCIISAPPTYLVGLDILRADLHSSGSLLAQSIGGRWKKVFSTSSAIPFTAQRTLFPTVTSLYGSDGGTGDQGSRSRQSMYLQSQDDSLKQTRHGVDDPEQCLDMALVLLEGDADKEGMKKARSMLSRALEANPTSVALWVVYLHIHYRNAMTIGKDDMFSHAIRYNEGSYELWLMYINSRVQLSDRLIAYDTAILALCRHASSPDRNRVHGSACILDLFLQSVYCLCTSGDMGKAIQRIYGLLPTATDVSNNGCTLLSDILACLTVPDKCIFWICCVYTVIYRKLPDAVVEQFELEKVLQFAVEWPPVDIVSSEKHMALELMKLGVDSVSLNDGMYEREVHFLSASHVQCVAVLEGIECSKNLLEKYLKIYPTCLELVLSSARLHTHFFGDSSFERFEDAVCNWPSEIPGVQCIWNQYALCALESGGFDLAKQLMVRWFESVWKVGCSQSGKLDVMEDDGLYHSPESLSPNPDVCFAFSNPKDELFGLLNLSLHRLLQNDHINARSAIDSAMKAAVPEDFEHCVKEHAMFATPDLLGATECALSSEVLSLLNTYLNDRRVLPFSEPLSRKFCQDIRKTRVRQLINNILGPVPSNSSLINSVLGSWFGPSLLPENYGDLKDLVDLVENLMELCPSNYSLALAVCKLITRKYNSSGVASASILFWASSILVNSIYQAFPVAPEHKWVETADILSNLVEAHGLTERFHQRALSVYPFSVKLWKSYYSSSEKGKKDSVVQRGRERGITLE